MPGSKRTLDAAKYAAMKKALLAVLPKKGGLTQSEMFEAVVDHLPESEFPGGERAGWWAKSVQLDLEAKGIIRRDGKRPLRWTRV